MVADRMEPGDAKEEFEIDFGKEFSSERVKKTKMGERGNEKRKRPESDDEEEDGEDEDEEEDDGDELEEEEEEEDEDEEGDWDEEEEEEGKGKARKRRRPAFGDDDDGDEDELADRLGFAGDAAISGDRVSDGKGGTGNCNGIVRM